MKIQWVLLLVGFTVFGQGCTSLVNVACYSIVEPLAYCVCATDTADCLHFRLLGKKAWYQYRREHPDCPGSKDFSCGFVAGYSDYLFAGGCGEPPAVPPRCYWTSKFETPEGHAAIDDWYSGFRAGAQFAKETGRREFVTVPTSSPPILSDLPPIQTQSQGRITAPAAGPEIPALGQPDRPEVLPAPNPENKTDLWK